MSKRATRQIPKRPASSEEVEYLKFDEDGDLTLLVGWCVQQRMLVDANALCRMSPVFRTMLKGPFKESKPASGDWMIELPEDHAPGFAMIMDIIHNQFQCTPTDPTVDDLIHVAILTNKYDMAKVLRPLAQTWREKLRLESDKPLAGVEGLLGVAYELGDAETFDKLARKIALGHRVNKQGNIQSADGMYWLNGQRCIDVANIMERIQNHRLMALAVIKEECRQLYAALVLGQGLCLQRCAGDQQLCTNMTLGHLLTTAYRYCIQGLFLPQPVEFSGGNWTVDDLIKCLVSIGGPPCAGDHTICNPITPLTERIEKRVSDLPGPTTAHHTEYMKVQQEIIMPTSRRVTSKK
ncbi:hypothetical protein QQS21_012553 [Conoideocrella luteorostrata]|uniref:BTB domain-containing protein n=1 Tax=Conoideocrella luteorostrata TaxID=1105319 RepID=A0AAJ0CAY6_9HYPO|nr:hypothetical protein QQS21_012553 [Conoideocrella luteorostrata]